MTGPRPLLIGEVLFDHFPDNQSVLGGAPFNVAWSLQGLGHPPLLVSRVGQDRDGQTVHDRMRAWAMDVRCLQTDPFHPTGSVQVTVCDGQPQYEIRPDQAYDHITTPELSDYPSGYSLLYHGSLAYRHADTRATLRDLVAARELPRFVDVNIRAPWFHREWLRDLLPGATWVKLNNSELATLTGEHCRNKFSIELAAARLRREYGGGDLLVTCGAAGAYAITANETSYFAPAPAPARMTDTVGAGDAFTAATIATLLAGGTLAEALPAAVRFASRTCALRGAITTDANHYQLEAT